MKKIFFLSFCLIVLCSCTAARSLHSSNDGLEALDKVDDRSDNALKLEYAAALKTARSTIVDGKTREADQPEIKHYLSVGIAYVDAECTRWFEYLAQRQRFLATGQKEFNIATDLTNTILGIAHAGTKAVAVFGASTAAINSGYNAYSDSYLSIEITKARKLVEDRQKLLAEVIFAKKEDIDFAAANADIVSYASVCTYDSIKEMVETIIEGTKVTPAETVPAKVETVVKAGKVPKAQPTVPAKNNSAKTGGKDKRQPIARENIKYESK